jgi:hypothetical protein
LGGALRTVPQLISKGSRPSINIFDFRILLSPQAIRCLLHLLLTTAGLFLSFGISRVLFSLFSVPRLLHFGFTCRVSFEIPAPGSSTYREHESEY